MLDFYALTYFIFENAQKIALPPNKVTFLSRIFAGRFT